MEAMTHAGQPNQRSIPHAIPVYFVLRENTFALDLVGPAEIFRCANRHLESEGKAPLFRMHFISAESSLTTSIGVGLTGFSALPESLPDDAMIVLVACTGSDDDFSSVAACETVAWLRRQVRPCHRLMTICTGAILAGHAGLLDGRQCTTHYAHYDRLRALAPRARTGRCPSSSGPVPARFEAAIPVPRWRRSAGWPSG